MGYDTLQCEIELPELGRTDRRFQSKSLDCLYDGYRLNADGTLDVFGGDLNAEPDAASATGFRYVYSERRWMPANMDGEVRFYAVDPMDGWAFSAYFVEGKLHLIRCVGRPDASPAA